LPALYHINLFAVNAHLYTQCTKYLQLINHPYTPVLPHTPPPERPQESPPRATLPPPLQRTPERVGVLCKGGGRVARGGDPCGRPSAGHPTRQRIRWPLRSPFSCSCVIALLLPSCPPAHATLRHATPVIIVGAGAAWRGVETLAVALQPDSLPASGSTGLYGRPSPSALLPSPPCSTPPPSSL
jgi:hypothetical protein